MTTLNYLTVNKPSQKRGFYKKKKKKKKKKKIKRNK